MVEHHDTAWNEMCLLYGFDGVSALCLSLQDDFDVDVCVLLVLGRANHHGQTCSEDALRFLLDRAATWRDVAVKPLRAVRIATKPFSIDGTAFYDAMKRCELEAEAVHIAKILSDLAAVERGDGDLVRRYLTRCGVSADLKDKADDLLRRACAEGGLPAP